MSSTLQRSNLFSSKKVIKLRTACDHCHASKVRCTGEKDGCRRCKNLDHECVYSESRVGKVPGIRNRNKRPKMSPGPTNSPSPAAASVNSTREASKEPGLDPFCFSACDDSFLGWLHKGEAIEPLDLSSFDSNNDNCFLDFPEDSSSLAYMSNQGSPNFLAEGSSEFDFQIPTLNFPIDGLQTPPINNDYDSIPFIEHEHDGMPTPASPAKSLASLHRQKLSLLNAGSPKASACGASMSAPPTRAASPSMPDLHQSIVSARGISACTEIIEYLDSQIHADLTALDAVIKVNKTAATELSRILSLPECRASASCPLLACIAVDQIVTLFECSIQSDDGLPAAHSLNLIPEMRFGFFDVDPEEMITLRAHFIGKELRRSLQLLETLNHQLRNPALQTVPSVPLHKQWTDEMTHRVRKLVVAVGNWKRECTASLGRNGVDDDMLG